MADEEGLWMHLGALAEAPGMSAVMPSNQSGNVRFSAKRYATPETVEELCTVVREAERVSVIGARHSCSTCADSDNGTLISLHKLETSLEVDAMARTVTCTATLSCGELAARLHRSGWALSAGLPSMPGISIAGAISTASHGSGDNSPSLLGALVEVSYVDADGSVVTCCGGLHAPSISCATDDSLQAVLFGCLGVLVEVTLRVEESFDVRQDVYVSMPWARLEDTHFLDQTFAEAYSVSLFVTDWAAETNGISTAIFKRRVGSHTPPPPPSETLYGGTLASSPVHPLPGRATSMLSPQGEPAGPGHERLFHYRDSLGLGSSDNDHLDVLFSEYLVPREDAVAAIGALRQIGKQFSHRLVATELRTVAADEAWLNPCYRRPSLAITLMWKNSEPLVRTLLPLVESSLASLRPRPHWGSFFLLGPSPLAAAYTKLEAFRKVVHSLDPHGKFQNAFTERFAFGKSPPAVAALDDAAPLPHWDGAGSELSRLLSPANPRTHNLVRGGHVSGRMEDVVARVHSVADAEEHIEAVTEALAEAEERFTRERLIRERAHIEALKEKTREDLEARAQAREEAAAARTAARVDTQDRAAEAAAPFLREAAKASGELDKLEAAEVLKAKDYQAYRAEADRVEAEKREKLAVLRRKNREGGDGVGHMVLLTRMD
jgi:xylitol oxidase